MSEEVEKPKAPEAKTAAPKGAARLPFLVAVHRINGAIEPGTPLLATDQKTYDELVDLGAVRVADEAESALYEKTVGSVVKLGAESDPAAALG